MKDINFFKNNIKFLVVMLLIIVLGVSGITYAIKVGLFEPITIDANTAPIAVNISYDSGVNGANIVNNGNMLPISDSLVTGPNVTDSRVLKAKFIVSNVDSNPGNTIYDISLRDIDIDCDLRTSDLKWRLYKNGTLLSSGNLSPTFDVMQDNRLVLTETQQDLTSSSDTYVFLLWISESCTGDMSTCTAANDQSKYLNKNLSATIKVELSTKGKKSLVRPKGSENSCYLDSTNIPTCNSLTYNGMEQVLVSGGGNYTLVNSKGTNAGTYVVTAKLNDGYKWSDSTTSDRTLTCQINKKSAVLTALDQEIKYGEDIDKSVENISINGLVAGDILESASISSTIADVGTGSINIGATKIVNSSGNDVTNNYALNNEVGKVTINCLNTAEEPVISDKIYSGNELTGVTGGEFIKISGSPSGLSVGSYKAEAVPSKNYCWFDGTTTKKEYTWSITKRLKADATSSISESFVSLKYPNSKTLTYTYDGDGQVSCSSSNTKVATCSVNTTNKTLTITSVASGTSVVTLNAPTTENYNSISKRVSVTVETELSGGSVKISGTNTYGKTLTATVTNTNPVATYRYQWYSNTTNSTSGGTLISGATSSSYTIGSGLAGKYIYVTVTASKANYPSKSFSDITDASSNGTATVAKANPALSLQGYQLQEYYPKSIIDPYAHLGTGTVTCSSSDTNIATCSVTDRDIEVTPKKVGTVTITVTVGADANYASSSVEMMADFGYKTYTVTLNNQSATTAGTGMLYGQYYNGVFLNDRYTSKMTTSTNKITLPTQTGYTFGGYYTGTSGAGEQLLSPTGYITSNFTNDRYSSNVTLYAKWTRKTYTVSYNANGGTGAPASQTKTYGQTLTLSSTVPTKTGYAFKGWSTSSTATTPTYQAGGKYTVNAGATLYAVWGSSANVRLIVDDYEEDQRNISSGNSYSYIGECYGSSISSISCTNGQVATASITNLDGVSYDNNYQLNFNITKVTGDTVCTVVTDGKNS